MPMNAPLTIHRYMSFEQTLDPEVVRRMAAYLDAGVRNGALSPTIDEGFGFDDIVEAHHPPRDRSNRPVRRHPRRRVR